MTVITVGGLFGSGALEIGQQLASRLQFNFVEQAAVPMIASRVNATIGAVWLKENHLCTWRERLGASFERAFTYAGTYGTVDEMTRWVPYMYDPYFGVPDPDALREGPHEIPDDEYIDAVHDVNTELAEDGDLVLTLRGGSATLRDRENVFHVGVVAPMDRRVARVAHRQGLSHSDAKDFIIARQDRRTDFFRQTVGTDQADPELYDLVVDTGKKPDSRALVEILETARVFGPLTTTGPQLDLYGISDIQRLN